MLNNQHSAENQPKSPDRNNHDQSDQLSKARDAVELKDNYKTYHELLRQLIKKIDGAYADSTIRAYQADFEKFISYCEEIVACPLPTDPEILCGYIQKLVRDGRSSASIRRMMSCMATIHKLNRFTDPTKDPDVIIEMRRMHRKVGRYQKQALGITSEILEKLLQATEAGNRGARDRALLLIAYDTLCRRSELVALLIEDIKYSDTNEEVKASVLIRKSKTDQLARGRRLNLSVRATDALSLWLDRMKNPTNGQLFKGINRAQKITGTLCAGQINRIYKRLAKRAGLSDEFIEQISGHSLRVGHAQDMVNSGESMPMIMSKGRWSKTDTVMRYVEHINYR
jgi:site-specific recombinase XerD